MSNNDPDIDNQNFNKINTNLFNKNKNYKSELLDNKTIKLVSKYDVKMIDVVKSSKKQGEGTYGSVPSAEIEFKFKQYRSKRLISAIKIYKNDDVMKFGFSDDLIKECATYARILDTENLGKGLFVKLHKSSQTLILEHYTITLTDLFKKIELPWNIQERLIRAVFFQIASGLKELHELGFIHKDLKPDNILLSHDGRVLIIDFGLTTYLVNGSDVPQDFYYNRTTEDIEPPEGNAALEGHRIGKSYDIWGLGCVLAYSITKKFEFDMYNIEKWKNKGINNNWRETVKIKDYRTAKDKVLDYFDTNLADKSPKPHYNFMKWAKDLLDQMLNIEKPEERPTIETILKHRWFYGLTIKTAISDVREILMETVGLGNIGRNRIISGTRRIRNTQNGNNNARNTDISSYFQIMKQPLLSTFLTPEIHASCSDKLQLLLDNIPTILGDSIGLSRSSFYTYLHALELFNRATLKDDNFIKYLIYFFNIALKTTADRDLFSIEYSDIRYYDRINNASDFIRKETEVIRVLNADTYPQVDGLVDKVVRKIGSSENKLSVARKIIKKIFASSATFDEYVDVTDDDNIEEQYQTTKFDIEGLLENFPRTK